MPYLSSLVSHVGQPFWAAAGLPTGDGCCAFFDAARKRGGRAEAPPHTNARSFCHEFLRHLSRFLAILVVTIASAGAADQLSVFGREWSVPVAADWKIDKEDGSEVVRLVEHRGPLPGPRRPIQFALADVVNYGTLIFDVDVKPLGGSLLLVFAYRDEAHFDYAHLSVDPGTKQPVHNGIFHVYGGERVRISSELGPAAFAASGRWYHVKLMHDATTGSVNVTVDGRPVPALEAVDRSLGPGKCGFGSFDETGEFKNVKIVEKR